MKLKRLKLRKNNWESETYEFDEVLTEFSSQKRVYEVVAKPVVEVCESQTCITTFIVNILTSPFFLVVIIVFLLFIFSMPLFSPLFVSMHGTTNCFFIRFPDMEEIL